MRGYPRKKLTSKELFELASTVVEDTMMQLPAEIAKIARTVVVILQPSPGAEVHPEFTPSELLGYYTGHTVSQDAGYSEAPAPPRIYLYLRNLYKHALSRPRLFRSEVRRTFLHELGHFLDWDEEDLRLRDLD